MFYQRKRKSVGARGPFAKQKVIVRGKKDSGGKQHKKGGEKISRWGTGGSFIGRGII